MSWHHLMLAAVFLVGSFLRFYRIGFQDFWRDEAFSLVVGRDAIGPLWAALVQDFVHPPLHYLLLHLWVGVIGELPEQVRALSAVFGCLSILAVYRLGVAASGRATGLLASALFAVSWVDVKYSQENRPYEAATFWTLAAFVCFLEAVTRKNALRWGGFVIASALAMYTHYYTAFPLTGLVLWSATAGRKCGIPRRWWFAATSALLPMASWLLSGIIPRAVTSPKLLLGSKLESAGLQWWSLGSALNYFNSGKWLGDAHQSSNFVVLLGIILFTLPAVIAVKNAWRERETGFALLLAAVVTVPFLAVGLLGAMGVQWGPRYVLFGLGPYYVLAAKGILSYHHRQIRLAAAVAALLFSIPALHSHYNVPFKLEVSRGLAHVLSQSRPGDCITFVRTRTASEASSRVPMEWLALRRELPEPRVVTLQALTAGQVDGCLRLWTAHKYDVTGAFRENQLKLAEVAEKRGVLKATREFAGLHLGLWELR